MLPPFGPQTKQSAEYIYVNQTNMLLDFDAARAASGKITSNYFCGSSLVTTAGQKGSLVEEECGAIEFDSERPFFWDIPVPITTLVGTARVTGCNFNACKASGAQTKPVAQPSPKPVTKPTPKPLPKPTQKPLPKPTQKPVTSPVVGRGMGKMTKNMGMNVK